MGWNGGTAIFDAVTGEVFSFPRLPTEAITDILHVLVDALEDQDWDTHNESQYWNTPIVRQLFQERNPEWFADDEDE